jgi:RNase P subunit RPR2
LEESTRPVCVKCGAEMTAAGTETVRTYRHAYERRTFECKACGHKQTYTMGAKQ